MNPGFSIFSIHFRRPMVCLLLTAILLMGMDQPQLNSISIKSLFIYNFTKHVDWPENGLSVLYVGVVDEPLLTEKLRQVLRNKKVKNKGYEVTPVHSPEEARHCQLVFLPAQHGYRLKEFVNWFNGQQVLIVTEGKGMAARGAAISIIENDNRLSFEVNETVLARSKLNVTNELLQLGIRIK
jgi:hypothetical protein